MEIALPNSGYGSAHQPTRRRLELLADWIEAQAYYRGCELSQAEIVDRFENTYLVKDEDDAWDAVGSAYALCKMRRQILANAYPFAIAGRSIEITPDAGLAYLFCLLASLPEQIQPLRKLYPQEFRDVFELIVARSLEAQLPGWTVFTTGWSQRGTQQKGAILDDVATWTHSKLINRSVFPSANDAQIDVAAVRRFPDGRNAFPVLLGQCATGVTDWQDKAIRPNIARWRKAVLFSSQPLALFAVPFALDEQSFGEASNESDGLVLDRYRICAGLPTVEDVQLRGALEAWVARATPLLAEAA